MDFKKNNNFGGPPSGADELDEVTKASYSDLVMFHEIGKTLTSSLNLKEILSAIMQQVSLLLKPKNWSLLLADEDTNELYFEIVVGDGAESLKGVRLPFGKGIAGHVAESREPLLIPNVYDDPRWNRDFDKITKFSTQSIVCVPLVSKGKTLGVIELINKLETDRFTDADMQMLIILADYAAIAIENARFVDQIKALTITDDLTGLYNSRYLQNRLVEEVERSTRYDKSFSLIFLDLDHFKNVNDNHGHLVGSWVLKELGSIIKALLRNVDDSFRYGGDEFVMLLPETDKEGALEVALKLRQNIRDYSFAGEKGLRLKLTASIGLATFPADADTIIDLVRLADQAMYYVKEHGRDNVESAQPRPAS